jgi:hypothetical protein
VLVLLLLFVMVVLSVSAFVLAVGDDAGGAPDDGDALICTYLISTMGDHAGSSSVFDTEEEVGE